MLGVVFVIESFLIAVSLALDAFAVSVSTGISTPGFGLRQSARMGLWFGAFQFAMPLIEKLGMPTIICNSLDIDADGMITGHRMRCEETKLTSVRAFHQMGMEIVASGDSHNDLGMIQEAEAGFFFRTTPELKEAFPAVPAYEEYAELLAAIRAAQGK